MKFLAMFLVLALLGNLCAQTARCTWDANSETNVAGYRVLYGTNSAQYHVTNSILGRVNNSLTISNLPVGVVYFVVQAFSDTGLSSPYSLEVRWTNSPLQAPKNLRLSANIQAGLTPTGPWTNLANVLVPVPFVDESRFFRTRLLLEELP